jgi:hypothetical protein
VSDPPTTAMPIPPPGEPRKRRWLVPTVVGVAAFFLGIIVGVGLAGGDSEGDAGPITAPPAPRPPTVTVTIPVAPPAPAGPTVAPAPAPAGDALSDEGWALTNLDVRADGVGDFSAVGRVTNESGQAVESAVFSLSALDPASGDVVATMGGAVSNVDNGETVTVEFFGIDDYQDGDWTYEFTVTGSF